MVDVLTLRLDETSQAGFDALRRQFFPPERNQISAHVTLFHALPRDAWISDAVREVVEQHKAFVVRVTGLDFLGRGVAYRLAASELVQIHGALAERFVETLPAQDRQPFRPHVVVQNKVAPEMARSLMRELERGFEPWEVRAEGLDRWNYLGGPWAHAETLWFGQGATQEAIVGGLPGS